MLKQSSERLPPWLQGQSAQIQQIDRRSWATIIKSRPEGEGQWTHIEHGPDNNPVADGLLVKAPYMTKWLAKPYYISMPTVTVAAQGRIYLATGHYCPSQARRTLVEHPNSS